MNDVTPKEVARFEVQIGVEDVARFARTLGYRKEPKRLAPPTFPARFLSEYMRQLADSSGRELVHITQSFAYVRRPRIGESLQCRILSQCRTVGERCEATVILELSDSSGADVARSESRLALVELS